MQMAEVDSAVAAQVQYVVGLRGKRSRDRLRLHHRVHRDRVDPADVTPGELAGNIVQSYEVSTANLGENDTLSAIDTSQLSGLEADLKTFVADADSASTADWAPVRRRPCGRTSV